MKPKFKFPTGKAALIVEERAQGRARVTVYNHYTVIWTGWIKESEVLQLKLQLPEEVSI